MMVGPGTGVAPFRNFIFEVCDKSSSPNDLVLFYGCRYEAKDFVCKEEFNKLCSEEKLSLVCAFSRDQEKKM